MDCYIDMMNKKVSANPIPDIEKSYTNFGVGGDCGDSWCSFYTMLEILENVQDIRKRESDPCRGQAAYPDGTSEFKYPSSVKIRFEDGSEIETQIWGRHIKAGKYRASVFCTTHASVSLLEQVQ
jgi:hypothetical protein